MVNHNQKENNSISASLNLEAEKININFFQSLSYRRVKSAFILMIILAIIIILYHFYWGISLSLIVWGLFFIQCLRLIVAKPIEIPTPLTDENLTNIPFVSLLVSAKNEEAVVEKLVKMLCDIDYPQDKYEIWFIDDYSTDRTPEILDQLALEYPQLQVLHRPENAGGGKCGALNDVTPLIKGDIMGIFDADAQVQKDLLKNVIPFFEDSNIGAVQTRKAICNSDVNFWTKGQTVEMILDSYYQQQRIAIGGLGELRGNGQFVRVKALNSCGGWNEETITDDLDLTIRLHLDNWEIGFLNIPPVYEEGVTSANALWHQRNRWTEGGFQRYLDYWYLILTQPLGWKKRYDLIFFLFLQYIIPTALLPDFIIAIINHRLPMLGLLNATIIIFSFIGMVSGLKRTSISNPIPFFQRIKQSILASIYMLHWAIVIPSVTARMSILPKKLKWVKTIHQGEN